MSKESSHEELVRKLERIHEQSIHMMARHQMWKELCKMVDAQPALLEPGNFFNFVSQSHLEALMLYIRRSVDRSNDAISLRRAIEVIRCRCVVVTRDHYLEQFFNKLQGPPTHRTERRAHESFDRLAGPAADEYPKELAMIDLLGIDQAAQPVKKFVDKRIAHLDRREVDTPILRNVEEAMMVIRRVECKYRSLLTASDYAHEPLLSFRWTKPLSLPWKYEPRHHDGLCMPWAPDRRGPPRNWR